MVSLLLAVIYIAFISLGLPDSILGSAWPAMYRGLGVPVAYAGIVTTISAAGTIFSSLLSARVIRRFGTGVVTTVSVAMTAVALFGYSFSTSFWMLCLWSVPYGLGAGSVDAALNNYVALHYQSKHMNWLHCFWGVGATVGPYVMGLCLTGGRTWNVGYQTVGGIQVALVAILLVTLPLWGFKRSAATTAAGKGKPFGLGAGLSLPGAKPLFTAFFCYCALEGTTGLWASSYMVLFRGISPELAAKMASLFYLGITGGRFLSGFVAERLKNRRMVSIGQAIAAVGILLVVLPLGNTVLFIGLTMIGLGCAPIYPSLLHQTPENFGQEQSQLLMGMQMAAAYTGSTLMPPLFGLIAQATDIRLYPVYLALLLVLMVVMTVRATKVFVANAAAKALQE